MIVLLLLACHKQTAPPAPVVPPGTLMILHTNDIHGHFLPEPADWLPGRPAIGGFARLETEVAAVREARGEDGVLLLDGGDVLTGTPLTDMVVRGSKGGAMLDFMELLRYDAWAVGNHEFDKGLDNLSAFTRDAKVVPLSANLRGPDGTSMLLPNQKASEIFVRNGVRVGVIGATTEGLETLMRPADFQRLKLLDVAAAVQAEVERLDPITDLVVVLSHIGVEDDRQLAARVRGIDLIVGGHSHTPITAAEHVGETWIVQAGSYCRSLGKVDMIVADDHITTFAYQLTDLLPATAPRAPTAQMTDLVAKYDGQMQAVYGEVISSAPALLGRDYNHESPLGRWITEVLRADAGTDVAFYNGGGLRADIAAGPVKTGDIYGAFPFGNEVMVGKLTGQEIVGILLGNMAAELYEKRGFLSLAGIEYTWRVNNGAPELVSAKIGGKPLDPAATYTVATNSYIAEQWQKHLGAPLRELTPQGRTDFDVALAAARKGPVADDGKPRAVKVGG